MIGVRLCREALRAGGAFEAWIEREAAAGRVDPRWFWIGARGAAAYVAAVASGDCAPDGVIDERVATCRACPSRTPDPDDPEAAGFCGPAFRSRLDEPAPTCGCPIEPAAAVASRGCPQRRFAAVTREGRPVAGPGGD